MLIDWGLIGCFCLDGTGYDLKLNQQCHLLKIRQASIREPSVT